MTSPPKVVLLALPLMARSGVYRSTHDLVSAANQLGLEWTALIGMRATASGNPLVTNGVREVDIHQHGRGAVAEITERILESAEVKNADVAISLISQTDIAMSRLRDRTSAAWVAWVRGVPWPAPGEQNAVRTAIIRAMETKALRRADAVWSTTPVLASHFASARSATIVPAGIAGVPRTSFGESGDAPLVWAGRVDIDKRPELFIEIVRRMKTQGRIFGEGPLASRLIPLSPPSLEWKGWVDSGDLWKDASIFVGTSSREAFGRSAVEAADSGLPIVISSEYGAAPLLFTDPELRSMCVLASPDPDDWVKAIGRLRADADLRRAVSDHVRMNAEALTIEASVKTASDTAIDVLTRLGRR